MRIRDERLRSGRLLGWFDPEDRQRNCALLLLVRGIDDVEPLTRIERVCQGLLDAGTTRGFEWHPVGDVGQMATVDPLLVPSRVTRVEAAELAMLSTEELETLLEPALARLAGGQSQLFPAAGGAVGSPAEGIQFLGREPEIRDALSRLDAGRNFEILAPRRSGKSSLMQRLRRSLPQDWRGVYINLEKEFTPEDLSARLWVLATQESYRAAQRRAEKSWKALLDEAVTRLADGVPVLTLLLDELVFFLQNQAPGEEESRRAALEILGGLDEACRRAKIRLVMANSLPLEEYLRETLGLRRQGLPELFRSLEALRLPPLDLEAPALELRRLLLGTGLVPEPGDVRWLRDNVDLTLPFPALRFLDFLASYLRTHGSATEEDLEARLEEFVGSTDAFAEFDSNLRRRGQQAGSLKALRACLDRLATVEPGTSVPRSELEHYLADAKYPSRLVVWLIETFPVVERDDGVALASRLFRRWWRRQLEGGDR